MENIFQAYPEEGKVLNIFYQLGLVFLMFSSGFNTCIGVDKKNLKTIGCVFTGATVLPMLAAVPFARLFQESFIGAQGSEISCRCSAISLAAANIPKVNRITKSMSNSLTLVGIQLNLLHNFSCGRFLLFFGVAFGLEAAGTVIMLLFTNLKKQVIINFAITMNARGGPGIVLATVAYSYQIIKKMKTKNLQLLPCARSHFCRSGKLPSQCIQPETRNT